MSEERKAVTMKNCGVLPLAELPVLDYGEFSEAMVKEMAGEGRVASYFGSPVGERLELFAVVARDWSGTLRLLRTSVGERFPSLTPRIPQLHLFEREIAEQYCVLPEGHPWFKPVRFHRSWREGRDPFGRQNDSAPVPGDMAFYRVEGEEVHEVAVGPVHAGVIEPGHFRFQCHGERVMHLEISLGYQHRDIERSLVGGPHPATPYQVEAAAGDTTIGHMSAYSRLIEALSDCQSPPRGEAIRSIALELERLACHVGDIGAISGDVGYLPTASYCGRLRGDYLNMTAELCGSRFGRGLVRPGGAGFDIPPELAERVLEKLAEVERDTRGALELFFDSPSSLARLEGTGYVCADDAEALGLVGVAARGCGLPLDTRLHHPCPGGEGFDLAIFEESGDVFARANVRRKEVYASIGMVRSGLKSLPAGPASVPVGALRPDAIAVSLCEGWRGEIVHVALTGGDGRFARYKIVDPSFHNWSGLAMALRGEQISDFPLCNKSFNLSYCGFDL